MTTKTWPLDDLRAFADGVSRLKRNHDALLAAAQRIERWDTDDRLRHTQNSEHSSNYDELDAAVEQLRAAIEAAR